MRCSSASRLCARCHGACATAWRTFSTGYGQRHSFSALRNRPQLDQAQVLYSLLCTAAHCCANAPASGPLSLWECGSQASAYFDGQHRTQRARMIGVRTRRGVLPEGASRSCLCFTAQILRSGKYHSALLVSMLLVGMHSVNLRSS